MLVGISLLASGVAEAGATHFPSTAGGAAVLPVPAHGAAWNLVILATGSSADVGVPFPMNATVTGIGFAVHSISWKDTLGDVGSGPNFTLLAAEPANVTVSVTAQDVIGDVLRATRGVEVVEAPTVDLLPPDKVGEVGVPLPIQLLVSGGSAPYNLSWSVAPAPPGNTTSLSTSGAVSLTVTPPGSPMLSKRAAMFTPSP